ncbi:tail fiber domain-containing protein [Novosphingobium rosa]|uniref:tail fiber domain-containing protein n=1 Tax=Novosphingobium rosa TaxID=76978 RepID=UPI00082E9374|nr:hypothetical protein [Novosphingobium rosa]
MPVSTTNALDGPYIGNGVTTAFPFTFTIVNVADVSVQMAGVAVTTGFTVTATGPAGQASAGGTVTFDSPVADGAEVVIYLDPAFTQDTLFADGSPWKASPYNNAYDKAVLRDQVLLREGGRSLKVPLGEDTVILPPKADRANTFAGYDEKGDPIATSMAVLPEGSVQDYLGELTTVAPSQKAVQGGLAERATLILDNVEAVRRQILGTTALTQLTGSTYPFQDLVSDTEPFGTAASPLVPVSAYPTSFTTLKNAYAYIGQDHVGGVQLALDYLQIRGAPDASSENPNYVARQFFTSVTTNMGGTALTMADSKAQVFGFSSLAVAYSGATCLRNLTSAEINVQASVGATVAYKSGLQIVAMPDDAVQGTVYDAAISLSNQAGAVGFGVGLLVSSNANGQQSVSSGGTLIAAKDFPACASGVNFDGVVFSQNAFSSNGFAVDGSGNVTSPNLRLSTAGAVIIFGSKATASSQALQFSTSGVTSGIYDSAMVAFGGTGAQGAGGIQFDVSNLRPAVDNATTLGDASHRFSQLYAATTTINTSDLTQKKVLGKLSDSQFSSVLDAIGEVDLIAFQFNDAIAAKGASVARKHAGIGAQQVQERFQAHGLDAFEWGVLGTDPDMENVEEEYQDQQQVTRVATREEPQIVMVDGRPMQKVVSITYDEPVFDRVAVVDASGKAVIIAGLPARTVPATDGDGKMILNADGTFASTVVPATADAPLTYPVPRMETVTLTRTVAQQKKAEDGTPAVIWSVRMHEFWALRMAYEQRERLKLVPAVGN